MIHSNHEVKPHLACLVLPWGTRWEARVTNFSFVVNVKILCLAKMVFIVFNQKYNRFYLFLPCNTFMRSISNRILYVLQFRQTKVFMWKFTTGSFLMHSNKPFLS